MDFSRTSYPIILNVLIYLQYQNFFNFFTNIFNISRPKFIEFFQGPPDQNKIATEDFFFTRCLRNLFKEQKK